MKVYLHREGLVIYLMLRASAVFSTPVKLHRESLKTVVLKILNPDFPA